MADPSPSSSDRGSTTISVHLYGVTEAEIEALMNDIASLLIGAGHNQADDGMSALLTAKGLDWPDTEEKILELVDGSAVVVIPNSEDEDDA